MTEKKWYALYTRSRNEKKVFDELQIAGIAAYLPMITRLKQWSDRKKKITEPLFRSYVFVYITEKQFFEVLNLPGAIRYITFENRAVPIPEQQIEAIRYYLNEKDFEPDDAAAIQEGQLVRVKHGPMAGLIGRMIRYKGKFRLVIRIEAVGNSITLTIPRTLVEVIPESQFG